VVAGSPLSRYYSSAKVSGVPTKNLQIGDFVTIDPVPPTSIGSLPFEYTFVTKIYGPDSLQITKQYEGISSVPIVPGNFSSFTKISNTSTPILQDFIYAGTTNSGNISIQIPKQAFSEEKATQYQYILTPARNSPGVLETLDQYGWDYTNEIYRSSILTTEATVEPGATSNTYNIDSGTPT
jgi:hypothetical protein